MGPFKDVQVSNLLLAPCFLLAVVAFAYSDVGWMAINFFAITAPVDSAAFFVYGTSDPGHAAGDATCNTITTLTVAGFHTCR